MAVKVPNSFSFCFIFSSTLNCDYQPCNFLYSFGEFWLEKCKFALIAIIVRFSVLFPKQPPSIACDRNVFLNVAIGMNETSEGNAFSAFLKTLDILANGRQVHFPLRFIKLPYHAFGANDLIILFRYIYHRIFGSDFPRFTVAYLKIWNRLKMVRLHARIQHPIRIHFINTLYIFSVVVCMAYFGFNQIDASFGKFLFGQACVKVRVRKWTRKRIKYVEKLDLCEWALNRTV